MVVLVGEGEGEGVVREVWNNVVTIGTFTNIIKQKIRLRYDKQNKSNQRGEVNKIKR